MLPASDRDRDERLRRNLFALRDGHQRQSVRFANIHLIKFYFNFRERFSYFDVKFEPSKSGVPVPGQRNIRKYNSSHCIWRLAGKIYYQVDWRKAPFKKNITDYGGGYTVKGFYVRFGILIFVTYYMPYNNLPNNSYVRPLKRNKTIFLGVFTHFPKK